MDGYQMNITLRARVENNGATTVVMELDGTPVRTEIVPNRNGKYVNHLGIEETMHEMLDEVFEAIHQELDETL